MTASVPLLHLAATDSLRLRVYLTVVHTLAGAAVLALPAPLPLRLACAAALFAVAAWCSLRRAWPTAIVLHGDGRCTVSDSRGGSCAGVLSPGSRAAPGLVLITLQEPTGRRRHFLLPDDAARPEELRRLRVRLRVAA